MGNSQSPSLLKKDEKYIWNRDAQHYVLRSSKTGKELELEKKERKEKSCKEMREMLQRPSYRLFPLNDPDTLMKLAYAELGCRINEDELKKHRAS